MLDATLADIYERDGVVSNRVLSAEETLRHRTAFERGEDELGPLHYSHKVHTVMTSPFAMSPPTIDKRQSPRRHCSCAAWTGSVTLALPAAVARLRELTTDDGR